ncbi:hypothetical protein J3P84_23005 [Pseudomonas sp. Z1-29]|uniref:hypothetical protein n=1 Tax=unclassified Pseudomonas TaxID=196821 RepID=UPI003DAA3BD6
MAMFDPPILSISLSALGNTLNVLIPDADGISADWWVFPTLRADNIPDWEGEQVPAGRWDDPDQGPIKLTGLRVIVPEKELRRYIGKEVELQYRFSNESSQDIHSAPVKLKIEK